MSNVLTRRFTRREIALMLLLVLMGLVGAYFYFVHYPITNRLEEIAEERDEITMQTTVAESRYVRYKAMKAELDEIFAMPEDEITVMPEYDNIQTLMNYFNVIFAGTDPTLNYDEVRVNGNVAARTIRFNFTAENYTQAKTILGQLTGTGYRCLLESVSMSPIEERLTDENGVETDVRNVIENSRIKVSGTITFYELIT